MDIQDVERNVEVAVNLLKALSNEKRLMVVCALYRGEKNVGELEKIVGLSQSALSQHRARLRRDGLVHNRRHAQTSD
jgi:DNA-binding transcriptional ArsR family regulator